MTVTYIYDGSFQGLLTSIFRAFKHKAADTSELHAADSRIPLPEADIEHIETDDALAARVENKLRTLNIDRTVYLAWLYKKGNIDTSILRFVKTATDTGRSPLDMLYLPWVKEIKLASGKVGNESHRYLQFIRFVKVGNSKPDEPGLYIADIEPLYDILPLIANHFSKRFGSQRFIIRDKTRRCALVWDTDRWYISELFELLDASLPADGEYEEMWREYFERIAIPWRKNPRHQQHFIPLRYRKFMTEFDRGDKE
jgi:probable DNA metabolism protein